MDKDQVLQTVRTLLVVPVISMLALYVSEIAHVLMGEGEL